MNLESVWPHDLLFGVHLEEILLNLKESLLPSWVSELSFPSWGVVRRDIAPDTHIPIGLRGQSKSQRFATFIPKSSVIERRTPVDIKKAWFKNPKSWRSHPIFAQLEKLAKIFEDSPFPWGIAGSLGFQIATGEQVTNPQSDLDLLLYMSFHESPEELLFLKSKLEPFVRLDVQVQTSYGAFNLKEWTTPQEPILWKTNTAPRLASLADLMKKEKNMKLLFLFPGQGAQTPSFLESLPQSPIVEQTLQEANDILGLDLRTKDTPEDLKSTYWTQMTIMSASVACTRFLTQDGFLPDGVLGLSLGSYSAAVACGAISFEQALKLLEKRAHIMQTAYPAHYGMVSVIGLPEETLRRLVSELHTEEFPLYIANINTPLQIILSGHVQLFPELKDLCLSHGASRVVVLKVHTPSHCPLFSPYISELKELAQSMVFTDPSIPFFSAMFKRSLYRAQDIRQDLVENMANPLNILETGTLAYEKGFQASVEMFPGKVLTNLLRSFLPPHFNFSAVSEFRPQDIISSLKIRIP